MGRADRRSSTNGGFLIGDAFEEFYKEDAAVCCLRSAGLYLPKVCCEEAVGDAFSGFLLCFFWRLLMHDSINVIKEPVSLCS